MNFAALSPAGLLTLSFLPRIGAAGAEAVARAYPTLGDIRSVRSEVADAAWRKAWAEAQATLERAEQLGVAVLVPAAPEYPELLRSIAGRPPVLFVKGRLQSGGATVACIGTRKPSRFGRVCSHRITTALVKEGLSIVSGLALGVDAVCHRAALEAGGHTVAVLAGGLDGIYPREHCRLAEEILEAGGAWISEQPFGVRPSPRRLVARNRIQSGMAAGTIVMQSGLSGGSMHTARFARHQGRPVFAPLPTGRHTKPTASSGLLDLVRSGRAQPLRGRQDYGELTQALRQAA